MKPLRTLTTAQINLAAAKPLIEFSDGGSGTNSGWYGHVPTILAMHAAAGSSYKNDRLVAHLKSGLKPGQEPNCQGGYPEQHHMNLFSALAITKKHRPDLWKQLSATEQERAEALTKCFIVTGAFMASDSNPFVVAKSQQRTLISEKCSRTYNPNFRCAMAGAVLIGMCFLGGPKQVDSFLNGYSHSAHRTWLNRLGLTRAHKVWSASGSGDAGPVPTASQIEKAVRDWKRDGVGIAGFEELLWNEVHACFRKPIEAGYNNGAGFNGAAKIKSNAAGLPNKGKIGMGVEFDSSDANGVRSSASYVYVGYRIVQQLVATMAVSGLWDTRSTTAKNIRERMNLGVTDLRYKSENGYLEYYKGKKQGEWTRANNAGTHGWDYTYPFWFDVIEPMLASA